MCPELGPLKKYTSVVMKLNPAVWKHLSLKGLPGNWPAVWFFSAYTSTPHEGRQCVVGMWIVSPGSGCVCVCVLECVRVCVCVQVCRNQNQTGSVACVCDSSLEKKKRKKKRGQRFFELSNYPDELHVMSSWRPAPPLILILILIHISNWRRRRRRSEADAAQDVSHQHLPSEG